MSIIIKILVIVLVVYPLMSEAIERQHYEGVTDGQCGIAKGGWNMFRHKHKNYCHRGKCSKNFVRANATEGEIPWAAFLLVQSTNGTKSFCSGCIINDHWLLTAGHCFEDLIVDHVMSRVVVGRNMVRATRLNPVKSYTIKQVIMHPYFHTYRKSGGYDIALVELTDKISFGPKVCAACLPPKNYEHKEEVNTALMAGYGRGFDANDDEENMNLHLQTGWVVFNKTHIYKNRFDNSSEGHVYVFWRTPADDGWTSCEGDSGGPMVQYDSKDRAVVIGLLVKVFPDEWSRKYGIDKPCLIMPPRIPLDIEQNTRCIVCCRVATKVDWIVQQITDSKKKDQDGSKSKKERPRTEL